MGWPSSTKPKFTGLRIAGIYGLMMYWQFSRVLHHFQDLWQGLLILESDTMHIWCAYFSSLHQLDLKGKRCLNHSIQNPTHPKWWMAFPLHFEVNMNWHFFKEFCGWKIPATKCLDQISSRDFGTNSLTPAGTEEDTSLVARCFLYSTLSSATCFGWVGSNSFFFWWKYQHLKT